VRIWAGRRRSGSELGLVAWVAVLLLAACSVGPSALQPGWRTTAIGLCEDYPEETRTIERARQDLAAAHAAGAQVLRVAFGWDTIEAVRGKYDWSFWDEFVRSAVDDYGIRLIPYVCYTPQWAATETGRDYWRSPPRDPADFGRFMDVIVRRYQDRIHSWELWNEPDNQAYWLGTPRQFAALVRAGSAAVHAADPTAQVVLGGIAGEVNFLSTLLGTEHVGPLVDVVNMHSYFETWHPSPIEHVVDYVNSVASLVRDTGGRQPLWMAETGYSSVGGRAEVSSVYRAHFRGEHTETAQAAALARTILATIATNEVSLLAWYRINDLVSGQEVIGDDNNRHLGLWRADGSAKPACSTFTYLAHLFQQPYRVLALPMSSARPVAVEVRAFVFRDGRRLIAAWNAMPNAPPVAVPSPDRRVSTIHITVPNTRARRVRVHDTLGRVVPAPEGSWRVVGTETQLNWVIRDGEVRLAELVP
jgi:hypothetical protein